VVDVDRIATEESWDACFVLEMSDKGGCFEDKEINFHFMHQRTTIDYRNHVSVPFVHPSLSESSP
jgi:hypothetical protein